MELHVLLQFVPTAQVCDARNGDESCFSPAHTIKKAGVATGLNKYAGSVI